MFFFLESDSYFCPLSLFLLYSCCFDNDVWTAYFAHLIYYLHRLSKGCCFHDCFVRNRSPLTFLLSMNLDILHKVSRFFSEYVLMELCGYHFSAYHNN